jgi:hypothetical protein
MFYNLLALKYWGRNEDLPRNIYFNAFGLSSAGLPSLYTDYPARASRSRDGALKRDEHRKAFCFLITINCRHMPKKFGVFGFSRCFGVRFFWLEWLQKTLWPIYQTCNLVYLIPETHSRKIEIIRDAAPNTSANKFSRITRSGKSNCNWSGMSEFGIPSLNPLIRC